MRTAIPLAVLLLAAATPAAPVPKALVGLVTNGGFEEGPEVDRWRSLDKGSDPIKGWVVTRGQIDYIGAFWEHGEGERSLDLHGSPGYGGVKQTLTLKKGRKYPVTFRMAGTPGGVPSEKGLWAAAGAKKKFTFDSKGKSNEKMGWETKEWEFTADADEVELEFSTAEEADAAQGPTLDAVSVKEKS
jgi:choice-of-anchor C domain-containing protein